MIITILNGIAYDHPSSFKGIILTYSHPLLHLSRFLRGTRSDPLNLKSNPLDLGHLRSTVLKSRPLFLLQVARGRWPLRAIRGSSLRARLRERRGLQRAVPDLPPLHLRARVLRLRSPQSSLRNWTLFVCVRERWPRFPRLSTSPIFQTVASSPRPLPSNRCQSRAHLRFEFFTLSFSVNRATHTTGAGNFRMQSGRIYSNAMRRNGNFGQLSME